MISYEIRIITGKGRGLFTQLKINKGQKLFEIDLSLFKKYKPEELQRAVEANPDLDGDHANYAGHGKYVIEETPAAYMNHSCDPNCCFKMHSIEKYDVIALCDITAGSELTHDYSACSIDQFAGRSSWTLNCSCGSKKCRKSVTGDYFTLPFYWQVQNYLYLPPSVRQKYKDRFKTISKISKVKIRRMVMADCRILAMIHIDAWREAYKDLVPAEYLKGLSYSRREEAFERALRNGVDNTYVAAAGNKVYGFITMGDCRDSDLNNEVAGEIWGIYLDPEKWRRKIGTYLCSWAEAELASQGYEKLVLWVFAGNNNARKFYETQGFRPDGISKTLNPGKKLLAVRYIKILK
jgi:ribosomal protein S18 acetylase RimI-like enzyme